MKRLTVDLNTTSYPILIENGLQSQLCHLLDQFSDVVVITDETVYRLYGALLQQQFACRDKKQMILRVPDGEKSKSLPMAQHLYTEFIRRGVKRSATVVAFGGGVVGDLAGFIAATYLRGIGFVQVPTTLLAQVDSSVGGKVGINHELGKNLIGAFYQPQLVLIDPLFLNSLEKRQVIAGMAEVIKYGFIADATLFDQLSAYMQALLMLKDPGLLEEIIYRCCEIKAAVVAKDEKESGIRAHLNFGHTIGHALEKVTDYGAFLHGEAIVHGMRAALVLSRQYGLSVAETNRALQLLSALDVPALPEDISPHHLFDATATDKKRTSEGQRWILIDRIGHALQRTGVEKETVLSAIRHLYR